MSLLLAAIAPALISAAIGIGSSFAQKEILKDMKAKGPQQPKGPGMAMPVQGSMQQAGALGGLQAKLELDSERAKAESLDVPEELR